MFQSHDTGVVTALLEFEMGKPCKVKGMDQRKFNGKTITTVFYEIPPVAYLGTRYRVALFVDGHKTASIEVT